MRTETIHKTAVRSNVKTTFPSAKRLFIQTIGCQMNVYDSEQIAVLLQPLGYRPTMTIGRADLVILNTCAIREKAAQKAFSFLGRLAEFKRKKPEMIIAVGGCVAQQEGRGILKRVPILDIVFGTRAIGRLPGMVRRVEEKRCRIIDTQMSPGSGFEERDVSGRDLPYGEQAAAGGISRFVTIMQGCDNFCTYCVVPRVRGREASRKPEHILAEIERLADAGVREVTLLGQNVNSYGKKEGLIGFDELLYRINGIEGLSRIRFTTSHPKDLSRELMAAFRDLGKVCNHIHLPVQSGSDAVLKRMHRRYDRESYLEKVASLRSLCPEIAVTSDVIVGFPGETAADFTATLDLVREVEFDGLFAFMYSDRPNAPAARFSDKVSDALKRDRLQELLGLQEHYTLLKNRALVGTLQEILVDGRSKRQGPPETSRPGEPTESDRSEEPAAPAEEPAAPDVQWCGRTSGNKIVHFTLPDDAPAMFGDITGERFVVRIEDAFSHSLRGRLIARGTCCLKGDKHYAA